MTHTLREHDLTKFITNAYEVIKQEVM